MVNLYGAYFDVGYRVVFPYLVMCYGDRVLGHLGGVCPGHIVANGVRRYICTK
jgi:hypothetical protein